MGASDANRSCPAVSQISNFMVRVGSEHFCVRNAAGVLLRRDLDVWDQIERLSSRTSDSRLLVLLKVIVHKSKHQR